MYLEAIDASKTELMFEGAISFLNIIRIVRIFITPI
jgi:hypothetical protein